jgi:acetyl-CoA carboxylase biotin carboxylase subunit
MRRLLIANRGEIAVRVARTARERGIFTIAVFSTADRDSLHARMCDAAVEIGPAKASESYLNFGALLRAAKQSGADAVHPGYGFLSENADFADAVLEAGLVWVGPAPSSIRSMGDKVTARRTMASAGVPVVPGFDKPSAEIPEFLRAADRIGYPVLVKASAGGGGKGMRRVDNGTDLARALEAARSEAQSAFGDPRVYLEKVIESPRHVEFQIFGDREGRVLSLFERECSIQRRHQKIVEEAPCVFLDAATRERMALAATAAGRAAGYVGAGTVEFLLDSEKEFYFLEMNTRLQVEHAITEETLGIDLVGAQLDVAQGQALPAEWENLSPRGHAIECRLYAEDPDDFFPRSGKVLVYEEPRGPGVRVDSGVERGSEVGIDYDPILAKIIALAEDRETARRRMARALREFILLGVTTNLSLLRRIIESTDFQKARTDTAFLSRLPPAVREAPPAAAEIAAEIVASRKESGPSRPDSLQRDPWRRASGWRTG